MNTFKWPYVKYPFPKLDIVISKRIRFLIATHKDNVIALKIVFFIVFFLLLLQGSRNPCQVAGCMVILEVFQKTASSALRYLSFNGILVHHQFCEIQQSLEVK